MFSWSINLFKILLQVQFQKYLSISFFIFSNTQIIWTYARCRTVSFGWMKFTDYILIFAQIMFRLEVCRLHILVVDITCSSNCQNWNRNYFPIRGQEPMKQTRTIGKLLELERLHTSNVSNILVFFVQYLLIILLDHPGIENHQYFVPYPLFCIRSRVPGFHLIWNYKKNLYERMYFNTKK